MLKGGPIKYIILVFFVMFVGAIAFVGGCQAPQTGKPWSMIADRPTVIEGATNIGSENCIACHETVKGKKVTRFHNDCEQCHGGGSIHIQDPPKGNVAFPSDKACLGCHLEGKRHQLQWSTSQHKQAGVLCSECHDPHSKNPKILRVSPVAGFSKLDNETTLCLTCHRDIQGKLNLFSHHPIREGIVSCVDCHNPHGDKRTALLPKNETCYKCHQGLQGPWRYEHAPVEEDCTICHEPHGSVQTRLFKIGMPTLCLRCHSIPDVRHARAGATGGALSNVQLRRCTNCHGGIHGTHSDKHLRY